LHNRLNLAAVLRAKASPLGEQEIDGAFVVVVATLEKRVGIKEGLQAVFCRATLEKSMIEKRKLSLGTKSRWSRAMTHALSIVQRNGRIRNESSSGGGQHD
jgi:hypothetical protein